MDEKELQEFKKDLIPIADDALKLHQYFSSKTSSLGQVINCIAFYLSGLNLDEEDMRHFYMLCNELNRMKNLLKHEAENS